MCATLALKILKGRHHVEDLGVDDSIILKMSSVDMPESCGLDRCGSLRLVNTVP
jgi:hypothetical protein